MLRKELRSSTNETQLFTGEPPWLSDINESWSFNNDQDYGISEVGNTIYIQYGQKTSKWASNRFWAYDVELLNETLNQDNSISINVKITPKFWKSVNVTPGAGVRVEYDISIAGRSVWTYSGNTQDIISKSESESYTLILRVNPESYTSDTAIKISVSYPNGEYTDNYIYVGLFLYNDNKKDVSFKPWAIRKSGVFKTLNNTNGHFYLRNSTWKDISKNKSKGKEEGNNRIRKGSRWLGQSKAGI